MRPGTRLRSTRALQKQRASSRLPPLPSPEARHNSDFGVPERACSPRFCQGTSLRLTANKGENMRRRVVGVSALMGALVFAAAAMTASSSDLLKDEQHFYKQSQKTYTGGTKAGSAWNMEVVGHNNLDVRGFNGDVWAYKGYAYVGHWGFFD